MTTRIGLTLLSLALAALGSVSCGPTSGVALPAKAAAAPDAPASPPVPAPVPAPLPAPTEPAEPAVEPPVASPAPIAPVSPPRFTITKGTRVLVFGDSMVTSGLGVYLQERVVARGGKLFLVSKGSSTTATWSEGRELERLLALTHPDIVLVVLASNQLFVPNPRARDYAVRSIVQRIGSRPCLWVGPAPWLPEKGIIGVVRDASAPCRFFDSTSLTLERQADRIHPTLQGGKAWAEAVWQDAFAD